MFESFYGLSANPFRLSADEQFRYAHPAYVRAWSYLKYALEQGEGFVLITGRPGTGKTTLIRDILSELDESKVLAVNLITNQFQSEELLRKVALSFGFEAHHYNKATLLTRISDYAMQQHAAGRHVIIVVDEAQNLTDNGLEELRLISNLQVDNQSLFQVFLIGQEEVRSMIYGQGLENIQQRIVANCRVEPMDVKQTQGYIEHRLGVVGWGGQDPDLDNRIYPLIQQLTQGVPREVNHIVGRLLLYGALEEKHRLTEDDLWVVVTELNQEQRMGFDLDEDLETFKRKMELSPRAAQVDRGEPRDSSATESDVVPGAPGEAEAGSTKEVGDGLEADSLESASKLASVEAFDGDHGPTEKEHGGGFEESEALLHEPTEAESMASTEMPGLFAENDERARELPRIVHPGRFDSQEHKHSHLLTNVDDLLDDTHGIVENVGRRWRWLFYPMAVFVLAGVLLVQKPGDLKGHWERLWSEIQQGLSMVDGSTTDRDLTPAHPDESVGDGVSVEAGEQQTNATSEPAIEPDIQGSIEHEPQSVSPAESALDTDEGADLAAQQMSPSTVSKPPAEIASQQTPESASVAKIEEPQGQADGRFKFDHTYLLTVDEETGVLAKQSRALFFTALDVLRANQRTMLVVTGIAETGNDPLEHMRTALREAGVVATLFLEAGVEKERISVESGRPEGGHSAAATEGGELQGTTRRTVRFKVVTSSRDS